MIKLLTTPSGSVVISDRRVHDCGSRSIRYDCENSTPCRQFLAGMSSTVAPRKRPLSGVGLIDRNGVGCCLTQPIYGRPRPLVYVRPGSANSGHYREFIDGHSNVGYDLQRARSNRFSPTRSSGRPRPNCLVGTSKKSNTKGARRAVLPESVSALYTTVSLFLTFYCREPIIKVDPCAPQAGRVRLRELSVATEPI